MRTTLMTGALLTSALLMAGSSLAIVESTALAGGLVESAAAGAAGYANHAADEAQATASFLLAEAEAKANLAHSVAEEIADNAAFQGEKVGALAAAFGEETTGTAQAVVTTEAEALYAAACEPPMPYSIEAVELAAMVSAWAGQFAAWAQASPDCLQHAPQKLVEA